MKPNGRFEIQLPVPADRPKTKSLWQQQTEFLLLELLGRNSWRQFPIVQESGISPNQCGGAAREFP
jgi:hypothetical protein